jgi:hypothetical protein
MRSARGSGVFLTIVSGAGGDVDGSPNFFDYRYVSII